MRHWLTTDGAGLIVISGMGGVGKTTLAVEWVERLAPGSYDLIAWRFLVNAPTVRHPSQHLVAGDGQATPSSIARKSRPENGHAVRRASTPALPSGPHNLDSLMTVRAVPASFAPSTRMTASLFHRMVALTPPELSACTTRDCPAGSSAGLEQDHHRLRIMALAGLPSAAGLELPGAAASSLSYSSPQSLVECDPGNPLGILTRSRLPRGDPIRQRCGRVLGGQTPPPTTFAMS